MVTTNTLPTLASKQNNIKICDVMKKSVGSSLNRTIVNPADDIVCIANNKFENTANNKFFNAVNKEFLDGIKSSS